MNFKNKHILSARQFNKNDIVSLCKEAEEMEKILNKKMNSKILDGKILATLFYEPSTRTRFSFETAMIRLGGSVISGADMINNSSAKKMESLCDTGKVVSQMADVIAIRHFEKDSAKNLSEFSKVPVINAGDDSNEHPTQALLDFYTIWKEFKGKIDKLQIGIIGDLKYGRVPHSQAILFQNFNVKLFFISPKGLKMPSEILAELKKNKVSYAEGENLCDFISDLDVIAMTRVQKERFSSEKEYEKYAGSYVLDGKLMKKAKAKAIIIHALPRVNEISVEVDKDPRAKYFEQVKNGVAMRMALFKAVLK
jgi:aspartate carbamoyltransferase catalytic subunit